ncbi:failed axon connections-like isoform X2 [Brevipalpus obovatus]|uniref:failed axon connections-like isoform X2 n=1 Tax=Brevipalpus obovatus TaxID=246614 RepID=UPI003D9E1117
MTTTETVEAQIKSNEKPAESTEAAPPADGGEDKKTSTTTADSSEDSSVAKKPTVRKTDFEQGKVYLYQFDRCRSIPSVLYSALRIETYLRVADIPYENVDHMMRYRSQSSNDLPFIELNGREIADPETIITELSQELKDLDSDLSEEQKIITYSLSSMLLNHTCYVIKVWRHKYPQEFLKVSGMDVKKNINSRLPSSILNWAFKLGFRSNLKDLIGHGFVSKNLESIINTGKADLQTLSKQLGAKDYFLGGKPHSLDCLAFAVLCQYIYVPFEGFDEYIKNETPNLLRFVEKMKTEYWKDWEEICKSGETNSQSPKKEGETDETKKAEDAAAEKKKQEDLKKEKEKKRKEKEERERKKKEEKEEKERKKREAKEKAEKEKAAKEEAAKAKAQKSEEGGDAAKKEETTDKDKSETDKPAETKEEPKGE